MFLLKLIYMVYHNCREELQQLCSGLLEKIQATLTDVLGKAKLTVEDIHSVEIIGGSCRIPAVKEMINNIFKKPPSTMLNMDEAVARGCALQVNKRFKMKEVMFMCLAVLFSVLFCLRHFVYEISASLMSNHFLSSCRGKVNSVKKYNLSMFDLLL